MISDVALRHIYEEHRELIEVLKVGNIIELEKMLKDILKDPDEVYVDRFKDNVKYCLKKLDKVYVNVVLVGNVVKTAYLIKP